VIFRGACFLGGSPTGFCSDGVSGSACFRGLRRGLGLLPSRVAEALLAELEIRGFCLLRWASCGVLRVFAVWVMFWVV